jgi:hypothetical protein
MEMPLTGGMGYVVLGGAEMTGVLVLGSLLLQAATAIKLQSTTTRIFLCVPLRPLRLCGENDLNRRGADDAEVRRERRVSDLFVAFSFILFVGERFTRDAIFTLDPAAKIDELAALRTEGTKGVVFPLGRLTAGWAFHESRSPERPTF